MGNSYVSVFACYATGLDAVQRLEQKKNPLLHLEALAGQNIGLEVYGDAGFASVQAMQRSYRHQSLLVERIAGERNCENRRC